MESSNQLAIRVTVVLILSFGQRAALAFYSATEPPLVVAITTSRWKQVT
jgi:hypothetical protein